MVEVQRVALCATPIRTEPPTSGSDLYSHGTWTPNTRHLRCWQNILSCGCPRVCDDTDCRPAKFNGSQRVESNHLRRAYGAHVRPPDTAIQHTAKVTLPAHEFWRLSPRLLGAVYFAGYYRQPPVGAFTYVCLYQELNLASNVRSVGSDPSTEA